MSPSPISYPIGPLVKWGIRVVPPIWALGESLLDAADDAPDPMEWRQLQIVQTRTTPTGTVEDKALMTFDVLNLTGGAIDSTWITADYTAAEARFNTYLTAMLPYIRTGTTFSQYRWYRKSFADPIIPNHRFNDSGPPLRLTTIALSGASNAGIMPNQIAASFTEKTAWPRHWGRWYLPSLGATLDGYGRFTGAQTGVWSNAAGALLNGLHDDELPLVVASTQADNVLSGYLLGVNAIQVDDVPDVQRRRRAKQPAIRSVVVLS